MKIFFFTTNNKYLKLKKFFFQGYFELFISLILFFIPIIIFLCVAFNCSLFAEYIKFESDLSGQHKPPELFKSQFEKFIITKSSDEKEYNNNSQLSESSKRTNGGYNPIDDLLFNQEQNRSLNKLSEVNFQKKYLFGTDYLGEDLFTKIFLGFEVYIFGGLLALIIAILLGTFLGSVTSFYDHTYLSFVANYIISLINSFPKLLFLFLSVIIWGINLYSICITIGIISSVKLASAISQRIRLLKNQEFIDASKQLGLSNIQVLFKHILYYNCRDIFILYSIFIFSDTILLETTMAYLNFGIRWASIFQNIDVISWGTYINEGKTWLFNGYYWIIVFPTIMILWVIFALNLIADSLKNILKI